MNLYVYYEVAVADAASIAVAVRTMQEALALAASNVHLLRRADTSGERQTWMEIYEDVADDFEGRLAASVDAHELSERTGARHVERFDVID
ncbi:MAG: DUF4936 family protein [Burkholderiaceae bacterium]